MKEKRTKKTIRLPSGTDLKRMSWQTIIDTFSEDLKKSEDRVKALAVERQGEERIKFTKKLALARLLLASRIKHMQERGGGADAKFFVDLVRLLETAESLLGAYEGELEEWNAFLYVLIEKMKAEKLIVYNKKHLPREPFEDAKEKFKDRHGMI